MADEPEAASKLRELMARVTNASPENDELICRLAAAKSVALIAVIAPYVGVRVSPVQEARAVIGLPDEFGIEAVLREVAAAGVKNAYLLVNSPGGAMDSSYKIARALRNSFDTITTFVPHVAASGGTLLALTGNEIVMGPMSHITALDPQLVYKDTQVSAGCGMKSFSRVSKWFETVAAEEAPYPRRALADKLDPFLMEEWNGFIEAQRQYTTEILTLAGYEAKSREIADKLVLMYPTHDYVITKEKAADIGLKASDPSKFVETWDTMRYWLAKYMLERETRHCIRYALPPSAVKNAEGEHGNE